MFVAANLAIAPPARSGWIYVNNEFLTFLPAGPPRNVTMDPIGLGPVVILLVRYQQHSPHPLRWWELPAYGGVFALYVYLWAFACFSPGSASSAGARVGEDAPRRAAGSRRDEGGGRSAPAPR